MKTIVLLNNIFSADMIKDFDYLKRNLDMKKFNIVSPLTFMRKDDKYDTKDFTIKLITSAISLGNMYNQFGTIETIAGKDKLVIYYGMAHTNVKADKIFAVKPTILDVQENLLDLYLKEGKITFPYLKSGQAEKSYKNIEEAVVYLNAL
jgi:hypothetical protein